MSVDTRNVNDTLLCVWQGQNVKFTGLPATLPFNLDHDSTRTDAIVAEIIKTVSLVNSQC